MCPACRLPMTATALVSLTGELYCDRHQGAPRCISCMAPADPSAGTAVRLCGRCAGTAVRLQTDVKRVLPPIADTLRSLGIRTTTRVHVRLVDATEIRGKHGGAGDALGLTTSRGDRVTELIVVRDLPYIKFGSTVSHEVMHAYLAQQRFPPLSPPVAEGLCQLLAYAWVRRQRDPPAQAELRLIAENNDPVYGVGFRRARAAATQRGVRQILEYVRQHGDLPTDP